MTHTTEIAIKLMEVCPVRPFPLLIPLTRWVVVVQNDTKLVSILYRTHKSLHPACKISGLYAFDALARAAKSYATKHKQTAHGAVEKGNCASFLLKLEGVLDGLVKDMLKSGHEEAKVCTQSSPSLVPYPRLASSLHLRIRPCSPSLRDLHAMASENLASHSFLCLRFPRTDVFYL
jgi:hypothetical protein